MGTDFACSKAVHGVILQSPVSEREHRATFLETTAFIDLAVAMISEGKTLDLMPWKAEPGRLLAIMGPSGSGKTTLLNELAGQLAASPRLHLSGHLDVNGRPSSSRWFKIAYGRQEDLFFSLLTVREILSLAAELQVTDVTSVEDRDDYVKKLLFKFGLVNCADSIVGDAKVHEINGGEKKSLSLACELIASPSVIFADEPTTGLDAFQAELVIMETLRQLAQDGR